MRYFELASRSHQSPLAFITVDLPSPQEFRTIIETRYWPDILTFMAIAMGITCVMFLLSKLAG